MGYYNKSMAKIRVAYNNIFRKGLGYTRRDSASSMFVSNISMVLNVKDVKCVFRERLTSSNNRIYHYHEH